MENKINSLDDPFKIQSHQEVSPLPLSKNGQQGKQLQKDLKMVSAHHLQDANKPKGKKNTGKCIFCTGEHSIYRCTNFIKLNSSDRIKFINSNNRCTNCFSDKHASNCPSLYRCNIGDCGGKHNSLLHADRSNLHFYLAQQGLDSASTSELSEDTTPEENAYCVFSEKCVLLSTAKVILQNQAGDKIVVHVLVDTVSMRSFVTNRVVSALQLKTESINVNVKGIGDTFACRPKAFCHVILSSCSDPTFKSGFDALVLDKLTSKLPPKPIKHSRWPHLENLNLADPEFMRPKDIDCILGAEAYACIALPDNKAGLLNELLAQSTRLGWILVGVTISESSD